MARSWSRNASIKAFRRDDRGEQTGRNARLNTMTVSLDCIELSVAVIALCCTVGRCVYLEETTHPLLRTLWVIDKQRSTPHTPLRASCEYLLAAKILVICYIHGSY